MEQAFHEFQSAINEIKNTLSAKKDENQKQIVQEKLRQELKKI